MPFFALIPLHILFLLLVLLPSTLPTPLNVNTPDLSLSPTTRLFQPAQILNLTLNKGAEALTPAQCAGATITFTSLAQCTSSKNTMLIIPHASIFHNGERCGTGLRNEYVILVPGEQLSDPRTAFINGLGPLFSILSSNARASNAFNVLQGVDPVYVGFEYKAPRICAGIEQFPVNTIYFFIVPSPDDLDLNFGFAYLGVNEVGMVSVRDDEELCLYKETRNLGPGQPEFATPTPSPSPARDLSLPSNLYDLDDPVDMDPCFPVTSPAAFVPPSSRPTPSVSASPTPSLGPTVSSSVTPTVSVSPSPSYSQGSSPSPSTSSNSMPEATGEVEMTPEEGDSTERACFPNNAMVQLEEGRAVKMSQLMIGDRVLVGQGIYSDIFLFTHHAEEVWSVFVNLTTRSGRSVALSKSHYVPVNGTLKTAGMLQRGEIVTLDNGQRDVIVGKKLVVLKGLHNPQTLQGEIVVDGVVVSTYTQAVDPVVAESLLAPLRWFYSLVLSQRPFADMMHRGGKWFTISLLEALKRKPV